MGYSKNYWEFGEKAQASAVSVYSAALNAGNIAAQEALRAAFEAAVDAVCIGEDGSEQFLATETRVAKTPSADPLAQREHKWLISFTDSEGNAGSFTIPCADLSLLAADGESMVAGATRTALIAAVEDFVLSKQGNAVTVTSIRYSPRSK